MGRTEGQVGKEGAARTHLLLVPDIGDGVVDQIFGEVVTLAPRRRDELVILHQQGGPLVGKATQEPVVLFKPHTEGPVVEGTGGGVRRVRSEMPFAEGEGVVAVLLQDFGNGRRALRDVAVIAGIAGGPFCDRPEPDRVVVAARKERGTRRRAQGCRVEISETEA